MSSILDALNKLEKEVPPQDFPLAYARSARKRIIPTSAIVMIGLVCVCVGAIGFVAYYQKSPEKLPEALREDVRPVLNVDPQNTPQPEASIDEQPPPLASFQETPLPLPSASQDLKTAATANKPETISMDDTTKAQPKLPQNANRSAAVKTEKAPVEDAKTEVAEKPVLAKTFQEPAPQVLTKEKNETPASIDTLSKEMPTQQEKPLPIGRLEGVGLKIQAISWGEIPRERLVVINNQVLREGDGIEGYQISRINPDDIVLHRNGNAYQLDFSLQGSP